jgi:hypothetical protein
MSFSRLQADPELRRVETLPRLKRLLREKGWYRKYAKANNGCPRAPHSVKREFFGARIFHPQMLFPPRTINNF